MNRNLWKRFVVPPKTKLRLNRRPTDDTAGYKSKPDGLKTLRKNIARLHELQYVLYAENKRGLLVVLQAMDAGGKDGAIRHVMSGLNPQGCRVTSFKAPSEEELDHDFLWRIHKAAPRKGEVAIFNRSHYEDVLVVRVRSLVPKSVWSRRYAQINAFERILTANDIVIVKFFLHISKEEQRQRLQARLDNPRKNWKFQVGDLDERKLWDDYMAAYEAAISRCSTRRAPWFVIPADKKWFRNLAISEILVHILEGMRLELPKATSDLSDIRVT